MFAIQVSLDSELRRLVFAGVPWHRDAFYVHGMTVRMMPVTNSSSSLVFVIEKGRVFCEIGSA